MDYKTLCTRLLSTAADTAGGVCRTVGSACSIAGGAGLVGYSASLGEKFDIAYYGEENSVGRVDAGAAISQLDYSSEYVFPAQHSSNVSDDVTTYLKDIVKLEDFEYFSIALICGGTVLNAIGSVIQAWNQGREERHFIKSKQDKEIGMPGSHEYKYILLGSVSGSVSQMLMGAGSMALYLEFSDFFTSKHNVTYPAESEQNITYQEHTLLLETKTFNFSETYTYDDKIGISFFTLPGRPNSIDLQSALKAAANITLTYGVGLFYKPSPDTMLFSFALIPGCVAGCGRHFFSRQSEHQRLLRVNREIELDEEERVETIELVAV